jgi:outer membrane protein assembly factor BamB
MASVGCALAQDWPQWRGPNRDARATGFTAPNSWPKELAQKWKVNVGSGDATPALVGDKLYVFARDGANEVIRCLNATTGKELWQDKYEAPSISGPDSSVHGGTRSSRR